MISFVDYRISNEELNNLNKHIDEVIKIPKSNLLYDAINGHVDIQLSIIDRINKHVIVQKDIDQNFLGTLTNRNIKYSLSTKKLTNKYPEDICLNAFTNSKYFVHNLKYTDDMLLNLNKAKILINVKQGYTKCSILPISENAIITSDASIYKELSLYNFDVLLIPPGDIMLPGLNYGFIGGCGGLITKNSIALFGNLKNFTYGKMVYDFLYKYDVKPIYLHNGKLIDRGSLLIL